MSVAAVILAAGGGSRFNGNDASAPAGAKLLTLIGTKPLVAWAVEPPLLAGLDEVIVVTGAMELAEVLPAQVTFVRNTSWRGGQATSLRAGLDYCEQQGHRSAVVGLGDLPGLTVESWQLIAAAEGGPIVFATYAGRRGHPVRLDAEVWPMLAPGGDEGARSVASRHPELVSELACDGDPADIDFPEDLTRWT